MRFLFLALFLIFTNTPARCDWRLQPLGSTQKLLAKAPGKLDTWTPRPVQLDCVRGGHTEFQFVVGAGQEAIESLSIAPTPLATFDARFIKPANFALFRENFVFVKHPSGNRIMAPKWWPDALIPLNLASQKIEANRSAVFWASLYIPEDAAPGDYFGELDILCNGQPKRLALSIHVRPLSLPPSHFRATVALYYDVLRDWYRKDGRIYTNEEWDLQKQGYANFLLDFGLNAYDPPFAWNDPRLDGYLQNPRVHSVRTPPLDSPDFAPALDAFKRTGTLAKAFYYWNDEPRTAQEFAFIRQNGARLKPLHIPQLVTHAPTSELLDSVDIWCPNVSNALGSGHLDFSSLSREQKAGHPTWLYTMVVPHFPYPTWLLDDDSSALESFAPLWSRIGASGFVYSMCHGWGPHPLENLESFEKTNGDGTLLYPAELAKGVGPMPSIRLILLRDAIEDLSLWNEAKARHLAPAFSFPANRKDALVYNRTALLDALESGSRAPQIPISAPQLWPQSPTKKAFTAPFSRPLGPSRRVSLQWKGKRLQVRLIGPKLREGEEVTVTLAPVDVQSDLVKQRIRWNAKGATLDEPRTDSLILPEKYVFLREKYSNQRGKYVFSSKKYIDGREKCVNWGGKYVSLPGNYASGRENHERVGLGLCVNQPAMLQNHPAATRHPSFKRRGETGVTSQETREVPTDALSPPFEGGVPRSGGVVLWRDGLILSIYPASLFPIQILTSTPSALTINTSANAIRFNISFRYEGKTVRLFPDGSDPFAMPILQRP